MIANTWIAVATQSRRKEHDQDERVLERDPGMMPAGPAADAVLGRTSAPPQAVQAAVARSPAAALFVRRAQAVAPDFALDDAAAPAVAEICRRLDGLPLALELAAARIPAHSPQDLLVCLEPRLALLTGGPRDLPPRQQTMRVTLDWSYHLLAPEEQVLFVRLAVFAGGWTLGAAEDACGAALPGGRAPDVPAGLEALVAQSLVRCVRDERGGVRFAMLETVREYAHERLTGSGELEAVRGRHAAHFEALVRRALAGLPGPEHADWLDRLDREQDNLRAVLERALERDDAAS